MDQTNKHWRKHVHFRFTAPSLAVSGETNSPWSWRSFSEEGFNYLHSLKMLLENWNHFPVKSVAGCCDQASLLLLLKPFIFAALHFPTEHGGKLPQLSHIKVRICVSTGGSGGQRLALCRWIDCSSSEEEQDSIVSWKWILKRPLTCQGFKIISWWPHPPPTPHPTPISSIYDSPFHPQISQCSTQSQPDPLRPA